MAGTATRPSPRPATPDGSRPAGHRSAVETSPVNSEPARIRPYQPDDLDELYRICVQTADNGQDGTSLFRDPRLPGHVYAAPYAVFEPSLAFVAEDTGGVGGYIVAALDSQAFERRLERDWWPALRASHPEPSQDLAEGLSPPERFALHWIHHPLGTPDELARGFPSHLHINLVPRLQGQGLGPQLIATVISALRDQGSHGLHLHVRLGNQRAAGFYRHLGFAELPAGDARVFTMNFARPAE
jgi:ribosomal protein S18 acetylase RimI-like enzyme